MDLCIIDLQWDHVFKALVLDPLLATLLKKLHWCRCELICHWPQVLRFWIQRTAMRINKWNSNHVRGSTICEDYSGLTKMTQEFHLPQNLQTMKEKTHKNVFFLFYLLRMWMLLTNPSPMSATSLTKLSKSIIACPFSTHFRFALLAC